MTFTDFLARRVQELEDERTRLRKRVRVLELSRDLWRLRATRRPVRG